MFSRLRNWIKDFFQLVRKDWLTTFTILLAVILISLIIFSYVFGWKWSGFFGSTTVTVTGSPVATPAVPSQITATPPVYRFDYPKTLWDWMDLLIVPIVLALGALWFNRAQRNREYKIAKDQRNQDLKIANEREQERTLQGYINAMTELVLEKDLSEPQVHGIARSLTLVVLRQLAGLIDLEMLYRSDYGIGGYKYATGDTRKGNVVQFLYEAGLIDVEKTVVALNGANLMYASLWEATLDGVNLEAANLIEVKLIRASLQGANLRKANLREANLDEADLRRAKLNKAIMFGVSVCTTDLRGADLYGARLNGARYDSSTKWPDDFDPVAAGAKLVTARLDIAR